MPTGYTADVQSGKVTDLSTFALQCARAFGALVAMKEEPSGATIPQELVASTYNLERCKEVKAELKNVQAMSKAQAEIVAKKDYEERAIEHLNSMRRWHSGRRNYETMLEKVRAWTPPTLDHQELHHFMEQQLRSSILFDCEGAQPQPVKPLTGDEWKQQRCRYLTDAIKYHQKAQAEEEERTAQRNLWLRKLRESLS